MIKRMLLALPLFFLLGGCYYLSAESRGAADQSLGFVALRENPDAYRGRVVLLGGTVLALREDPQGSRLLVEQHPLDSRNLPQEVIRSQGLFLATTDQRLSTARFPEGMLVTLAGTVIGSRTEFYGGKEYRLPVVAIREIHDIVIEEETHWGAFGGI